MKEIKIGNTFVEVIQEDITKVEADIIVNAANSSLMGGGGVDGAIHKAGGKTILDECIKIRKQQGGCPTGEAVITNAGNLSASYVIHTVGPVWNGGKNNEEQKLRNCYRNTLKLADEYLAKSIAFPNISTGVYKYPKEAAAEIAIDEVFKYIKDGNTKLERIVFVCFDNDNFRIYKKKLEPYLRSGE
ncbi:MAG: O-acetyl-ADP-ribose deacetylase [Bacillota bacterium]